MKKTKWSIIWALLLSLAIPISSNAQPPDNSSSKTPTDFPKSLPELILNNIAGVGGFLTGVSGLITALYSLNKSKAEIEKSWGEIENSKAEIDRSWREIENSKAEIEKKIGLGDVETQADVRRHLLEALSKDKGEFLEVIRKLGGFVTEEALEKEFEKCANLESCVERFTKILRDPNMGSYIQTQCPFVTKKYLQTFDFLPHEEKGYLNFANAMDSAFQTSSGQKLIESLAMPIFESYIKQKYTMELIQNTINDTRAIAAMN